MRIMICVTAAAVLAATGAAAASTRHFAGAELLPQAKVTLAQARACAYPSSIQSGPAGPA